MPDERDVAIDLDGPLPAYGHAKPNCTAQPGEHVLDTVTVH